MRIFKEILRQAGVICSLVCIAAAVLDWYNPFMDFSGHVIVIQKMLYLIVLLSAFFGTPAYKVIRSFERKEKCCGETF